MGIANVAISFPGAVNTNPTMSPDFAFSQFWEKGLGDLASY
jgi:hypothetical protein